MIRRLLVAFLIVTTLVTSIAPHASAQDNPPAIGTGTQTLFIPFVQKVVVEPVKFTPPAFAMVYGQGVGPVTSAEANGNFCPELLDEVTSSSTQDICVAGQFPGFYNKGQQLSAISSQDGNIIGAVGAAQPYELPIKKATLFISGVGIDATKTVFGGNEPLTAFAVNLGLADTSGTGAAAVNQTADGMRLMAKLLRMPKERSVYHGLPVAKYIPIRSPITSLSTTLGIRCAHVMEGHPSWAWYPTGEAFSGVNDLNIGGIWGPNTDLLNLDTVANCMGPYRYLSWPTLIMTWEYQEWRIGVLNDDQIPSQQDMKSFSIPQWGDTEFGGTWLVTYAAAAAGGTYIILEYVVGGAVTFASSLLIIPTKALQCAVQGDTEYCWIESQPAASSELIPD